MKALSLMIPLSLISLFYNLTILLSVTLNLDWVRTLAAGGQFTTFPMEVRFLYFLMAIFMVFLMAMLWKYRVNQMSAKESMITKIICYIFCISAFLQIISPSAGERWNGIPAAILATTFILISRREKVRGK